MRWSLPLFILATTAWAAPEVTLSPDRVLLGETDHVTLRVQTDRPASLRHAVSVGTLTRLEDDGSTLVFRWTPPDIRYPSTALVLFWEGLSPTPEVAVKEIPLVGRTTLEMDTEPGASVRVVLGGKSFGPSQANAKGRVKVDIQVPPGVRAAEVVAVSDGQRTSRSVPLQVPTSVAVAVAHGPEPMGPSGGWLLVASSAPLSPERVTVRGDDVDVAQPEPWGGRGLVAQLKPQATRDGAADVTVSVPRAEPVRVKLALSTTDPEPPPLLLSSSHWRMHALFGAFTAGGANTGIALEVGVGYSVPALSRLTVELSLGVRSSGVSETPPGLAELQSSLLAMPVQLSGRYRLYERWRVAFDVRAGVAALPFRHSVSAPFQTELSEGGLGFEAFGAVEALYRVGRFETGLELRGAYTRTRTPHLSAQPGGLVALLGARYVLP